jgi:hypothetical protein
VSELTVCDACGATPLVFNYYPNTGFFDLGALTLCDACCSGDLTRDVAEKVLVRRGGSLVHREGRLVAFVSPPAAKVCGNKSPSNVYDQFTCALPAGHGGHHCALDRGADSMCWTHPKCKGCSLEFVSDLQHWQLSSSDAPYCERCYYARAGARAEERDTGTPLVIGVDPGLKEAGSLVYGIGDRVIRKTRGEVNIDPIEIKIGHSLGPMDIERIGREVRAELEKMLGTTMTIPDGCDLEFVTPKNTDVFDEVIREANRALSVAILGQEKCRRCSGRAVRDGFCGYCYGSADYADQAERDRVISRCMEAEARNAGGARARNESALAADRPRSTKASREAAKPHPWEAWSTASEES